MVFILMNMLFGEKSRFGIFSQKFFKKNFFLKDEIRLAKGKIVHPKIGEGKQKAKREKNVS